MARPLRIEYNGAWYHVFNRGLERRIIFQSDTDRVRFLVTLAEASNIYGIEIHAFALMQNHYHLLVRTPQPGLARAMRHINGTYTQWFNKTRDRDGPLFRGRYKAVLVDEDDYLIELVRYIHLNPVRAGLCMKANEYRWSSHKQYLYPLNKMEWIKTQDVLERFGDETKTARTHMNEFVNRGVPVWFSEDIKKNRCVLGSRGFCDWVYKNCVSATNREIPFRDRKKKVRVPIKTIFEQVGAAYNVSTKAIRAGKTRKKNEARAAAIYFVRQLAGLPQKEIAKWFGVANEYAIAKSYERFRRKMETDRSQQDLMKEIKRSILSHVKT